MCVHSCWVSVGDRVQWLRVGVGVGVDGSGAHTSPVLLGQCEGKGLAREEDNVAALHEREGVQPASFGEDGRCPFSVLSLAHCKRGSKGLHPLEVREWQDAGTRGNAR